MDQFAILPLISYLYLIMGLRRLAKKLFKTMFKTKNITDLNDQPGPTPHPCGNWSVVDCNLLARGYNAPFFSDPHEEDVQNNSTLPCSPDDCNNAGLDNNSLSTGYYLIIGFGGLLFVGTLWALYKKWGSRLQNDYQRLSDEGPLLTKDHLTEHDRLHGEKQPIGVTPQHGYSNNFATSDSLLGAQHPNWALPQARACMTQPNLRFREAQDNHRNDGAPSSDKSYSPDSMIKTDTNFFQRQGNETSDDESSSDKSYSPDSMIKTRTNFYQQRGNEISDDESSSDNGSPERHQYLPNI